MNIICYKFDNKNVISIELKNLEVTDVTKFNDFSLLFNNSELIGINVFDEKITKRYENGLIYCDDQFIRLIHSLTNIDLSFYKQNLILCAKIKDMKPVEGTHLNYCDILISENEEIKVICGAKNARKNLVVVCATNGSILPNGTRIVASKVMNKDSNGMLCSYKELNILDKESNGIIELNNDQLFSVFKDVYVNLRG